MPIIYVINNLGEKELFSSHKLYTSAKRSGASNELANKVVDIISKTVRNGDRTSDVYKTMKALLLKLDKPVGIKFSLKESIRKLGPTGYPFEVFMGELFARYGFKTKIETFIKGKCTEYEVDFQAEKEKNMYLAECKFHSDIGSRVDINVILIAYAGFLDMQEGRYCSVYKEKGGKVNRLVVTNTKFTNKAIKYANCYGINLLGWHYPVSRGIEYYIEKDRLYPITILPSINKNMLDVFFRNGLVFCKDLTALGAKVLMRDYHLTDREAYKILEDIKSISNGYE